MAGNDFKKVTSGSPLKFSARWFNSTIDAIDAMKAAANQQRSLSFTGPPRACDVIKVRNDSETDCNRFAVLGIDTIRFTPTDNLPGFKETPILQCVEPTEDHRGKFVILLQPAKAAGEEAKAGIVDACVAGYVNVKINVTDEGHEWADVKPGDVTMLQSYATGSARIIYREPGTGTKWALVRVGQGDSSQRRLVQFTTTVASSGGVYGAWEFNSGDVTITSGDLNLPYSLHGRGYLVINPSENGQPTHGIKIGSFVEVDVTPWAAEDGSVVAVVSGEPVYRTDSPVTIGPSDLTTTSPDETSWRRDRVTSGAQEGDTPAIVTFISRWSDADPVAGVITRTYYGHQLTFDTSGKVYEIGGEVIVQTEQFEEACPE